LELLPADFEVTVTLQFPIISRAFFTWVSGLCFRTSRGRPNNALERDYLSLTFGFNTVVNSVDGQNIKLEQISTDSLELQETVVKSELKT
jgi:hypothetical protein